MTLGLGLGLSKSFFLANIAASFNFENSNSLPDNLTYTRSGTAWYQDNDGYFQIEPTTNTPRFGTMYGSRRGVLIEKQITALNLYSRPVSGTVADHFSSGDSIASIVTEAENPAKDLTDGDQVWEFDNSGGGVDVDVEWDSVAPSGGASGIVYTKTISGSDPVFTISGSGTEKIGQTVGGYTLRKIDGVEAGTEILRLTVPAGSVVRCVCANLQQNLGMTSFIDTDGSTLTRNRSELIDSNPEFWHETTEGTIFLDFTIFDRDGVTSQQFEARGSGSNQNNFLWSNTSGIGFERVFSSGVNSVSYNTDPTDNEINYRWGLSYKTDLFIGSRQGLTSYTDTSGNVPDVSLFNMVSFLSINRSGEATNNGIFHRFTLFSQAYTEAQLNNLTNPATASDLGIAMFGDSNIDRLETQFSGRPQQRFEDNITNGAPGRDIYIINQGKGGSTANFDAAADIGGGTDFWSASGDVGGGNEYLAAEEENVNNTSNELRRIKYFTMNLGANDLRAIGNSAITTADYKASVQNVLNITSDDYGIQRRYIMQNLMRYTGSDYTDAEMQEVQDAMIELVEENPDIFVGSYDNYDTALVDNIHCDEDGYNQIADRLSNVILSTEGLEAYIPFPTVQSAEFNSTSVTLTTDNLNLVGSEVGQFRVEQNSVAVTISSVTIDGNRIILNLASPVSNGDTIDVWVGYGRLASITVANLVKDSVTGYPVAKTKSTSATNVAGIFVERGEYVATLSEFELIGPPAAIDIDAGSYTSTGYDITLITDGEISIGTGSYITTGNDLTFARDVELDIDKGSYTSTGYDITLEAPVGNPLEVVGTAFTGTGFTNNSTIVMPDTDIAILLNNTSDQIQGHSWSGSVFATSGTNTALTINNDNGTTRTSTDNFLGSNNGSTWQEYNWTGSGFSTVGSSFNLGSDAKAYSSSDSRIFVNQRTGNILSVWDESGGWSQSATLAVTYNFFNHAICVIDKTTDAELIAVYNRVTTDIRLYTYNGTTLSEVSGSSLTWKDGTTTVPWLARINNTTFAYVDSDKEITIFTTDGSTITEGATVDISADLGLTMASPMINETPTDDTLILAGRNTGTIAFLNYNA